MTTGRFRGTLLRRGFRIYLPISIGVLEWVGMASGALQKGPCAVRILNCTFSGCWMQGCVAEPHLNLAVNLEGYFSGIPVSRDLDIVEA